MDDPTVDSLSQRLDRLEREIRWWRRLGTVVVSTLVLAFLLGATGQKVADEVRAKLFVLVDVDGKDRAALVVTADGPVLALYDRDGKFRADLAVTAAGSALALRDRDGAPRAMLGVPTGGPALGLYDRDGKVIRLAP